MEIDCFIHEVTTNNVILHRVLSLVQSDGVILKDTRPLEDSQHRDDSFEVNCPKSNTSKI